MNSKEQNARMLDPERFKVAKNMSLIPGGPMNNNGQNVTGLGNQSGSMSGVNEFPYGDSGLENDPRMGANVLNPMNVGASGLQQNFPMGLKNNSMPFGMQQQPPSSQGSKAWEGMEATRLNDELKNRGLPTGSYLGLSGMPAQPAPGAFPSDFPGSSGPPLMRGTQAAGEMAPENSMNGKTPGSTPTKIKRKRA